MEFSPAQVPSLALRPQSSAVWPLLTAGILLCLPLAAIAQTAQPAQITNAQASNSRIESLIDNLGRVRTPTSVTISPDGATLAWSVNGPHGAELHLTAIALERVGLRHGDDVVAAIDEVHLAGDAGRQVRQ